MKEWHQCYRPGNLESQIALVSVGAQYFLTSLRKRKLNQKVFTFQILKDGKRATVNCFRKKIKYIQSFCIHITEHNYLGI